MLVNNIKSITTLRKYCKQHNTPLTIKKYPNFEIIFLFNAPIGYIHEKEIYLIIDKRFSPFTVRFIKTLFKITNNLITTRQLIIICKQLGITIDML